MESTKAIDYSFTFRAREYKQYEVQFDVIRIDGEGVMPTIWLGC